MMKLLSVFLCLCAIHQTYSFDLGLIREPDLGHQVHELTDKFELDFLDNEREIIEIQQNQALLRPMPVELTDFELSGNLERDLESSESNQEYLDSENEIEGLIEGDVLKATQLSRGPYYLNGIVGHCPRGSTWTPWHNRDRPSGTGDWEVKSLYLPKGTCADKNPSGIQARLVSTKKPFHYGGNNLSISPLTGLVCQNKNQKNGRCKDYEIRFCCKPDFNDGIVGNCPKDGVWTPWHSRDLPSGTGDWEVRSLYQPKGTCADEEDAPLAIQARLVSNKQPYQTGGDVVTVNPSLGLICQKKNQKDGRCNDYEVRYCCRKSYNNGIVGSCPKDGVWTPWHSRDLPSGTGDWEVKSLYQPKGTCADEEDAPLAIQARLVSNKQPYQTGGDVVTVNPSVGLICKKNNQQDKTCNDYEVRYCCKKEDDGIVGFCHPRFGSWTPWHNRDSPGGTGDWEVRSLYQPERTCADDTHIHQEPLAIQARLVSSKKSFRSSGEVLSVDPDGGLICRNRDQTDKVCENYEVRYCCKREKMCPGDQVLMSCGSACPNICGERQADMCTMQCVPGCQCPRGLWLTNDNKCVEKDQCPKGLQGKPAAEWTIKDIIDPR